jgi:cytochrome b subunit of formate dehydrogenase
LSRSQAIFVFDLAMLVALCAVESLRIAGIAFHEWLGISLIAVFIAHLLLSWNWIAAQTKQHLLETGRDRTSYLLNLGLFVVTVITIFTGIAISEEALPTMGFPMQGNRFWHGLHSFGANLMVLLVGLHVALNWDWILKAIRQGYRNR